VWPRPKFEIQAEGTLVVAARLLSVSLRAKRETRAFKSLCPQGNISHARVWQVLTSGCFKSAANGKKLEGKGWIWLVGGLHRG